jgi:mannosidase alpha-like ER degradation enhancer 1
MAESLYLLYLATKDPIWRNFGRDMIYSLQQKARVVNLWGLIFAKCMKECGFAAVEDVESHALRNHMDSFFLSETCKYLYLLFDDNNFVHKNQVLSIKRINVDC